MAFDLLEGYEEKKPKAASNFDLLEGYEEPVNDVSAPVKQKVKKDYTYPNQDLSGIENNPAAQREFQRNVDKIYDIPQVPMPPRNNAGYTNSNGEVRNNLPTFSENHPIISSIPEAGKQFGVRAVKSFPEFGKGLNDAIALMADKAKNINPNITNNPLYKVAKSISPAVGLIDSLNKSAAPVSDFAKSNARYWENAANNIKTNPKYQGMQGLKSKETFLPTLAGEVGGQATNLLMAMGGGAAGGLASKAGGLGKLGTAATTFAGTSIPNLAQEGQYLEKIEQFKNINGRMPNAEELKQIQNVALSEKAINTALESVADRLLFGKLFPEGTASKGIKNIAKSMGQQGVTEALTEAAQEGTSIGAEKLLGLNQDNWQENLARAGEAGLLGGLTGSVIGGASTAVSQPYDSQFPEKKTESKIEEIAPKTAEKIKNKTEEVKPAEQPKVDKKIEEIAPKTAQKIQENNAEPLTGKVENQYEDNAKVVFDGNKKEALTPEELGNVKAPEETNPNIEIDENSAEALKGHVKKPETENKGIVIDKNDAESLSGHVENKPKQYKVVNGKTVLVDANPTEEIKKIAPKTTEQIERVKNAENLQANETVGQEGNAIKNLAPNITADKEAQEEQKALIKKCYEVLAQAGGKKADYIKMTLNNSGKSMAAKKRAEKLKEELKESGDKIDQSTIAGFEGYFGDIKEGDAGIVDRALQILDGKYDVSAANKIENKYNEMGEYYENEVQKAYTNIENSKTLEELNEKYKNDYSILENFEGNIPDEVYGDYLQKFNAKYEELSYNNNKGNSNVQREISSNDREHNTRPESDTGAEERAAEIRFESNSRGDKTNSGSQVAIKGLEEESAKAVQRQQDEVTAKENAEKYSTTQDGKQDQMFNTEQFKNGQQMLFDTSNMPKNESEIKKTTVTMKSGKEKEIEYVEEIPEGFVEDKGATTAPKGYTWYHNNKSITSGERKRILVKDKATEEVPDIEKILNTKTTGAIYQGKTWREIFEKRLNPDETKAWWIEKVYKTPDDDLLGEKVFSHYQLREEDEGYKTKIPSELNSYIEENFNTSEKYIYNPKKSKKSEPKKKEAKERETKKLEDAGEFLQGNRKQDTSLTWDDLKDMNDLVRAKNTTKARVYPKPSIEDLKSEGFSEFQAGVIQNVYNKINAKPAAGYDKIEHQQQYVDTINEVMSKVKGYIKSHSDEFTTDLIAEAEKKYRSWSYDYNKSLFDAVFPDTENKKAANRYSSIFRLYPEYNRKALIIGGNKFTAALQLDNKTLIDVMKAIDDSKKVKEKGAKVKTEPWEKTFIILEPDKWNKEYAVANKKNKQVLARYATKEEAIATAQRVYERIERMKAESKKENFERDYIERRENNRDVTTEELQKAFGFRGVNFGNWATAKERQDFANFAYDSLYDLAELLNLPPKAISLNGQLGLAYGAQGTGGKKVAAAHYIPEYKEINLTKEYGAGSLAHEWWHALDNYFGNQANSKEYSREYALSLTKSGELRPELFETLENLQKQIKQSPFTEEDIKKRAEQLTIQTEARIKRYADYIRQDYAKTQNSAELNKIVDDLVENKEKYKTYSFEDLYKFEDKFFKLLPANRDTFNNRAKFSWLTNEIRRLNDIEELAHKGANKSEYLESAEKIDAQEGGTYWSKDTELGARAFAAYIFDKMESQNILNKFLSDSGGGAVLNLNYFKELAEGEERESLTLSTTPKGEEKARIFKAFDKLFDTIKTRETDKGVELYSKSSGSHVAPRHTIAHLTEGKAIEQSTNTYIGKVKDVVESTPEFQYLRGLARDIEDVEVRLFSYDDIKKNGKDAGAAFNGVFIKVAPNAPIWHIAHEMKHARDYKRNLKSITGRLSIINAIIGNFLDVKFKGKKLERLGNWWYNAAKMEKDAYAVEGKVKEHYGYSRKNGGGISKYSRRGSGNTKGNGKSGFEINFFTKAENGEDVPKYAGKTSRTDSSQTMGNDNSAQNGSRSKEKTRELNKNTSEEINQVVRDKVYDWHGNLESDRYDVDKALNSFINLTKHKAKNLSQKTGVKISDKQLREILPFLRERTGFPKSLERDDLRTIFDKLSGSDKAELAKLADNISDKFEKYYTNYKDAKGEQTEESIENHISHIWDLDDKKKSLLTNYITTNSRFAKKRTISTLLEGIDGIEINGEKVQFKPKTLDYAEILKSSSDNLIKATHDSILANEIKNLKYKGESMVLPASKAPSEWIEVNHPALNKAVYMGAVGEDEIPMLMKTPVKVHPEIADYVKAIFEVQKPNKFLTRFDALNGTVKQVLLGLSGFHGYALSESSVGNVGVGKTLKELNPFKIYDQIKNDNYDIYKNEEAAKRAINAGVQLGTPSDLQRNLTEEFLLNGFHIEKFGINKITEPVGKLAKPFGIVAHSLTRINNKILWDVLHNNFKILAFNTAIENLGGNVTKEQERAVAQWVNDSFGGQAWELLGIKKSSVKAASRVLLSPDWNFSTIRQANAMFNSSRLDKLSNSNSKVNRVGKLLGINEEFGSKGARGKLGRGFWLLRSAIYFGLMYNALNAAFREKDRKEHPDLYPDEMTPIDYTIWANAYPMDNFYEKALPNIFIGRNKDGSARYLRLGKQFREVPEFLFNFMGKLGGKTAPLLSMVFRTYFGMGIGDAWNKLNGGEAYLDQNIWEGYGENAEKKEGLELAKGRAVVALKSVAPFMMSKYLSDNKHEFSWWDLVAQTHAGGAKSTVFKQTKEALKAGKPEAIEEIERRAYQDGVPIKDIEGMIQYAKNDYKSENSKKYKNKLVKSFENEDEKEYERIRKKMTKKHLSDEEQRRIRDNAWKAYQEKSKEN